MNRTGIEPATPGLQGIALIHYTTGPTFGLNGLNLGVLFSVHCDQYRIYVKQ